MRIKVSTLFLYLFAFSVICSCCHPCECEINEQRLISDYGSFPFENWINWSVLLRSGAGYYLACFQTDSYSTEKIVFINEDSIKVLVQPSSSTSKLYLSLNELKQTGEWSKCFPHIEYDVFCQIALFTAHTGIVGIKVTEDRVTIQVKGFELIRKIGNEGYINEQYYEPICDAERPADTGHDDRNLHGTV